MLIENKENTLQKEVSLCTLYTVAEKLWHSFSSIWCVLRYHDLQPVVIRAEDSCTSGPVNGLETQHTPTGHTGACGIVEKMNESSSETGKNQLLETKAK